MYILNVHIKKYMQKKRIKVTSKKERK